MISLFGVIQGPTDEQVLSQQNTVALITSRFKRTAKIVKFCESGTVRFGRDIATDHRGGRFLAGVADGTEYPAWPTRLVW